MLAHNTDGNQHRERRLQIQEQRRVHSGEPLQAEQHQNRTQHSAEADYSDDERQIATTDHSLARVTTYSPKAEQRRSGAEIQKSREQYWPKVIQQ